MTSTGLKFIRLANGTVQAHYKTRSSHKLATIVSGLKDRAYTVTNTIPLLHTGEMLLIVPVGIHVSKDDFDKVTEEFEILFRAMRDAQKAKATVDF